MDNGQGHAYFMTGEEIFIFGLTKMAHGTTNRQLCEQYFGGCPTRWSFAYPYLCRYFDKRYRNCLGLEGLERFVYDFPKFAKRVAEKINKDRLSIDPLTRIKIWIAGLGIDPVRNRFFAFIDGSFFRSSRPGSGPDGDYEGAQRKPFNYIIQRAVYTGYKKLHGLLVLCIMLPNGLNFVYGPASARV